MSPEEIKAWLATADRFTFNTCRKLQTLAYIEQLEAQVPKWISVDERLPDGAYSVLCRYLAENGKYYCTVGNYLPIGGFWETDIDSNDCFYACDKVTHWMELPEGPKEV